MSRFMLGRAGEGEADLERSAEFAQQAGDPALERSALVARLRPVAWGPTPAEDGIAFCDVLLGSDEPTSRTRRSRSSSGHCCSPCAADFAGAARPLQTHGRSSRSSVSR